MLTFVNVIVAGLLTGCVYGLMALGLSVIFGVIRIVNFAHGEMMAVGMYAVLILNQKLGLDPFVLMPLVALALFLAGYALQRYLINRYMARPEH
jgi:branched-chain amino acid transport system permease protein